MNERDDGARAALGTCFREHQALVHGVVFDRCGDPRLAEEITAQTFEAAASRFAHGRGGEVTPAWLTVVAKRRLIDHWRHLSARSRVIERLGGAVPLSVPAPELPGGDPEISAALDAVPPRQRTVLTLRYLDDWGLDEIADGMGLSYRAVESLLARARRSFAAAVAAETARAEDTGGRGRSRP